MTVEEGKPEDWRDTSEEVGAQDQGDIRSIFRESLITTCEQKLDQHMVDYALGENITEGKPEDWREDRIDEIGQNYERKPLTSEEVLGIMRHGLGFFSTLAGAETDKPDPGAHYRHHLTVKLTPEDIERGYVRIQLDPFRIASVYRMSCQVMFTMLKKVLRAGNGGHKDLGNDLDDIESAINRKRQMMDEDEFYQS